MITTMEMYSSWKHQTNVESVTLTNEQKRIEDYLVYAKGFMSLYEKSEYKTPVNKALANTYQAIIDDNEFRLIKIKERRAVLEAHRVNKFEYKFLVKEFNKLVIKEIIDKGYVLSVGNLGHFRIKSLRKRDNSKRRINWGISNKIKQEIINRGGTPFEAYYEEDAKGYKHKIGDNGGEEWLVKNNRPYDIYWVWKYCKIPNATMYKLIITKDNRENLNNLSSANPEIFTRYLV